MFYVWSKWLNITFYNSLDIDNQTLQNDRNKKLKVRDVQYEALQHLKCSHSLQWVQKEWDISRKDISFYQKQHAQIY